MQPYKMLVIVPVYNGMPWFQKCIGSLLNQNTCWLNHRILIVDDHSTDGTWDYARAVCAVHPFIKLMRTSQHNGAAFPSTIEALAAEQPSSDTVIVIVDGDDWLQGANVFNTIANAYNYTDTLAAGLSDEPSTWMTYGQYISQVRGQLVETKRCVKVPSTYIRKPGGIREFATQHGALPYGHVRSFLYGLFQRIPTQYLLQPSGRVLWGAGGDAVMMVSMAELAREHAKFIDKNLYVYNMDNPNRDNTRYPGGQHDAWQQFITRYPELTGLIQLTEA